MYYQGSQSDYNWPVPSWSDLILYSHRNLYKTDISAITYNRIDAGYMMTWNDHEGI